MDRFYKRTWLVEARVNAGITQIELAEKLGESQSTISELEKGKRLSETLSIAMIKRISSILNTDFDTSVDDELSWWENQNETDI